MEYNLTRPWLTLDDWQKEVLKTEGNIVLRSGRQCGKSTIISIKAAEEALNKPNQLILIAACVLDQAELIFRKAREYIEARYKNQIVGRVTLHFLELKNGSKILCRAIGDTGEGIRGYTANIIIIDEAAFVNERVWSAITPIISVSHGKMILLSTPHGRKGYYYNCFSDKDYTSFHVSALDCPRHTKEFLDKAEARMTKVEFATEYLGEFIDELREYFTDEWIEKVCVLRREVVNLNSGCYLGVDVARLGKDETTFEVFNAAGKTIKQVENIHLPKTLGPEIEDKIKQLTERFNLGRDSIGFDSAGVGGGTFDYLMRDNKLKRRMVALDNATRPIDKEGKKTRLLKEHMYKCVKAMGERGDLKLLKEDSVIQSLKSIQYEYKSNGELKFWGVHDHIMEGVSRGVWVANNKSLNILAFC